jgi:hypothetical protein
MYKLYKIKKEIMIKLISVTKPRPYKTSQAVHKALQKIKLDLDFKNLDEVFIFLIKKHDPKYLKTKKQ